MTTKNALIFLLFIIIGFTLFITLKVTQNKSAKNDTFVAQPSTFKSAPPANALSGTIADVQGKVQKIARHEKDPKDILENEKVLVGERLQTDSNSKVNVSFLGVTNISLDFSSDISFASTSKDTFLAVQQKGLVTYVVLVPTISVRTLRGLVELHEGTHTILVDAENQMVTVTSIAGISKVALVDKENVTHVVEVAAGRSVRLDIANQSIGVVL